MDNEAHLTSVDQGQTAASPPAASANKLGHVPVIDSLRGIAATMVCFYHFIYTTTDYIYNESAMSIAHKGYYGVHVFFVISGVVIPLSMLVGGYTYTSFFAYIKKRFIRIEPPYLFSIALAFIYLVARNYVPGSAPIDLTPDFRTILLHLGYFIPFVEGYDWIVNVYWSLAVEFQYYLFLCLLFPLLVSQNKWKRWITYPIFFGLAFVTTQKGSLLPTWLPLFMVGISYVLWRFEKMDKLEFGLVLLTSLLCTWYYVDMTAMIFGGATLATIHFLKSARNGLTKFFGNISYSLYLIHTIVGSAVINFLSHSYRAPWQKPLVILLGFAVSVIGAYIMYRIIEKPSKKWASKVRF